MIQTLKLYAEAYLELNKGKYGPEKNSVFGHFSRSGNLASNFLNLASLFSR